MKANITEQQHDRIDPFVKTVYIVCVDGFEDKEFRTRAEAVKYANREHPGENVTLIREAK